MFINLICIGFCSDCTKKFCELLKESTKVSLNNIEIFSPDCLKLAMTRCGVPSPNLLFSDKDLNNLEKINTSHNLYSVEIWCKHGDFMGKFSIFRREKMFVLGYSGSEYIRMTNKARRKFLTLYANRYLQI